MISNLFNFDSLALISTILILFITFIVGIYAKNYLMADSKRNVFLVLVSLIAASLIITFMADNIFLMAISWLISNLLLVAIMVHKASWKQALESGILALKNFTIGFVFLSLALIILHFETGKYQISQIIVSEIRPSILIICCIFILITALSQSAIYPFHSWLISSLNSPTPASAIMHAGIVNGGGIILARFSPLFFKAPDILTIAFILGIISAIMGTLWKLIQSNVKSMLACSTMSQMGFMIAQCAMGLFPAAIAHLFWHGMFKSYLFLSSPGSWQERRLDPKYPPNKLSFIFSLFCGFFAALIFMKINHTDINTANTTFFLVAICFIAASQIALIIIDKLSLKNLIVALVFSSALSAIYAYCVLFIEKVIAVEFFNPQPLNFWHIFAIFMLFSIWMGRVFRIDLIFKQRPFLSKLYVITLNASQPKSTTITLNRNQYNYK